MNKFFKVITSIAICISVIASMCTVSLAEGYENVSKYSKEIDMVTQLGIMEPENNKQFFSDDILDRSEMVRILMTICGADAEPKQYYNDIPNNFYAFSEISKAVKNGYVDVNENKIFSPNEPAKTEEAVKIILYLLNYKDYLEATKQNLYAVAQNIDLFDGAEITPTLTRGLLAKLIYNSFSCGRLEMSGVNGDMVSYEESDKTMLYYMHMKTIDGIVYANQDSYLYYTGKPAPVGCVKIGDYDYYVGETNARKLIGYDVEAICTDTDDDVETLTYISAKSKNKTLVIKAEDIDEVANTRLKYGNRSVALSPSMSIIHNGVARAFDSSLLNCKNGTVTFLSNDNGKYNIVLVNEFESFSVASVNYSDKKIYLKNGTLNHKTSIDLSQDASAHVYYYKNGAEANFEDISADSVISVEYANNGFDIYTIYISDNYITGTLNATGTDKKGQETLIFDGTEYNIAKNIVGYESVILGSNYTAYLDFCGKITELKIGEALKNYGALLKRTYDENNGVCYMRMLCTDGKVNVFKTTENKVNYKKGNESERISAKDLYDRLSVYEYSVIMYDLNSDGCIQAITVAAVYDTKDVLSNMSIFTVYKEISSNVMASYGMISGIGTANSAIFIIPENVKDESDCKVQKGGFFNAGSTYSNIKFYDVGLDAQAGAVLVRAKLGSDIAQYDSGLLVVSSMSKGLNADNDVVNVINGYQNGNKISLPIATKTTDKAYYLEYDINKVKTGDILIYSTNSNGEISAYAVLYVDSRDKNTFKQFSSLGNGYSTTRECSTYHANVRYMSNDYLTIEYNGETVPTQNPNKGTVYIINRTYNKVKIGELGDIRSTNFYTGEVGSEVYIRTNRNGVGEVFIYED